MQAKCDTLYTKKHLNRQLTHSYYENPKYDNSEQLLRNVKQQIFRDANFYAVPSPCFLRNQIFAKFDNLIPATSVKYGEIIKKTIYSGPCTQMAIFQC